MQRRRVVRRGILEEGSRPEYAWEDDPGYPPAGSRAEQVLALVRSLWPHVQANEPASFVEGYYQSWSRNVGAHRVVRKEEIR